MKRIITTSFLSLLVLVLLTGTTTAQSTKAALLARARAAALQKMSITTRGAARISEVLPFLTGAGNEDAIDGTTGTHYATFIAPLDAPDGNYQITTDVAVPLYTFDFSDPNAPLVPVSDNQIVVSGFGLWIFTPYPASGYLTVTATGPNTYTAQRFYGTATKATAILVLSSSGSQSYYGQPVTFTATLSGSAGTPGGSVTFMDGTNQIGVIQPLVGGTATVNAELLTLGTHPITFMYTGDNNYSSGTSSVFQQTVNQAPVTVIGIIASDKVYDGNPSATLNTSSAHLDGVISTETGDVSPVTSGATGTFSDKNVGTGKQVNISGVTITGTKAGNYILLTQPTTNANITPKPLTVTGITSGKVYDGTTDAPLNISNATLVGVVDPDHVNLHAEQATGTFSDKNVGTDKQVTISGVTIIGPPASDNYTVTQPVILAAITARPLTVTADAKTKTYGDPEPALTYQITSGSLASGDVFAGSLSRVAGEIPGTYDIQQGTLALSANYTLTYAGAILTINKKAITVTADAKSKVYGDPDPALTYTVNPPLVNGDVFTGDLSRVAGENVGTYAIQQGTLSAGANYNTTFITANFTIALKVTTTAMSSSAVSSVYGQNVTFTATVTGSGGGTPTGTVAFMDGASSINVATLIGGSASYSISTLSAGSHAISAVYNSDGNFAGSTSPAFNQTLTPKALTVTGITANNKVYDRSTTATLTVGSLSLFGVVGTDNVTANAAGASGLFADKTVANGKLVTISGVTLGGTAAGNYSLTQPSATADITAKELTVTGITADNKVYDGTMLATLNVAGATLVGVVSGDDVTMNSSLATGMFSDPTVGTGKTVTIEGLTITGADEGNYTLTQPTTLANITASQEHAMVLGAGLISSAAGSLPSKPTFTGKGYFAFAASNLGNGPVPTGLTVFVLKNGGLFSATALTFNSTSYDHMVVSGATVTYGGAGTVNHSSGYGFFVTTFDGHSSGTSDKFRIKIWDKNHGNVVVYDNQMGAADDATPTSVVSGGIITITKSGNGSTAALAPSIQEVMDNEAATEIPTEYALYNAYPNPFNPSTSITFDLPEAAKVRLVVFDMLGREVAVLVDEESSAGHHTVRFDASRLSSGTYIYRLQAGSFVQTKKMMLMK